jgi:hypothetical protein
MMMLCMLCCLLQGAAAQNGDCCLLPVALLQLFAGLHHGAPGSGAHKLPEWPPAGSIGSLGMGMGMSPGHMMMFGTPPLGRSVDMVDVCTQLMEAGGECGLTSAMQCVGMVCMAAGNNGCLL